MRRRNQRRKRTEREWRSGESRNIIGGGSRRGEGGRRERERGEGKTEGKKACKGEVGGERRLP